jgi:hypothetical protein
MNQIVYLKDILKECEQKVSIPNRNIFKYNKTLSCFNNRIEKLWYCFGLSIHQCLTQ